MVVVCRFLLWWLCNHNCTNKVTLLYRNIIIALYKNNKKLEPSLENRDPNINVLWWAQRMSPMDMVYNLEEEVE